MKRVLLDTHALVWWLEGREKLSAHALDAIAARDTTVYVSAASAWELAIKVRIGKFKPRSFVDNLEREIQLEGFSHLAISIEHALRAGALTGRHRDPFDRMLVAQALTEGLRIVSKDASFDQYGVERHW
jgi:PIN domain nuclease of toxin-antitoxin system